MSSNESEGETQRRGILYSVMLVFREFLQLPAELPLVLIGLSSVTWSKRYDSIVTLG